MSDELQELIDRARLAEFPPEEREAQRQSFAYGNTHFENELITKQTVEAAARELADHGEPAH